MDNMVEFLDLLNIKDILLFSTSTVDESLISFVSKNNVHLTIINDVLSSNDSLDNVSFMDFSQLSNIEYHFDIIIIENLDFIDNNFFKIIVNVYGCFPCILFDNESLENDVSKCKFLNEFVSDYDLLFFRITEDMFILSSFSSLDNIFTDNNIIPMAISRKLDDVYNRRYLNENVFIKKCSGFFYPLVLLFNVFSLGGLKNLYLTIRGYNKIQKDAMFNVGYYLRCSGANTNNALLHYILYGSREGFKPSYDFNQDDYLSANPDLKDIKVDPFIHYVLYGRDEKRPLTTSRVISESKIRGHFQSSIKGSVIKGWVAKIGDKNPVTAYIAIDGKKFEICPNLFREDLKSSGINDGFHAFEFNVPDDFINGMKHELKLLGPDYEILDLKTHVWVEFDFENSMKRFLSFSMTSPEFMLPFNESRKKMFSFTNNIVKYLISRVDEKPLVSIIMPVYNREDLVGRAIQSVLSQTYENFELIVVNDGSSDNSINVIRKFSDNRIKIINNKGNIGVSRSRNVALSESSGKYIMYLDSDNDWDKRYVETMVGAFTRLDDADAVYSGQYIYEGSMDNLKYIRYGSINKGLVKNRNYIDLNAYVHTRDIYERYGGFSEDLGRFVDWDLILKYMTYGRTYSIPVVLSNYYKSIAENSITNNSSLSYQADIVVEKQEERLDNKKYDFKYDNGVSVIIPSYESLEDLKNCLSALFRLNDSSIEVIVVDNNSCDDVVDYLSKLEIENKIKLILNSKNMGFTYAVTQGINISNPENDILLLNNDAVVTSNAICLLRDAAYTLKDCGLTVPQQILPANTKTMNVHVPYANKDRECDVNLSVHHKNIINVPLFSSGEYTELSFAPFFCVYIRRDVYDDSIGLDFELGRHYRSDAIYCNYIREILNKKIYHVSDARVYHKLQHSTDELKKRSQEGYDLLYVQNRWSDEEMDEYGFKRPDWDV